MFRALGYRVEGSGFSALEWKAWRFASKVLGLGFGCRMLGLGLS